MAINVVISGCTGRMGSNIKALMAADTEAWNYVAGWSNKPGQQNEFDNVEAIKPDDVDVVIDFSLPEAFESSLKWAMKNKVAFLSGTTGLGDKAKAMLDEASTVIPVLLAANTSLGINVVNELIPSLKALKDFDVQIVEAHHNKKIDAPSGTAILLQDSLTSSWKPDAPEPLSVRGGGIFGEHEIRIMSDEEVIEIKHTALTRSVFAKGALYAAKFLSAKPAGRYSMSDVIKG